MSHQQKPIWRNWLARPAVKAVLEQQIGMIIYNRYIIIYHFPLDWYHHHWPNVTIRSSILLNAFDLLYPIKAIKKNYFIEHTAAC